MAIETIDLSMAQGLRNTRSCTLRYTRRALHLETGEPIEVLTTESIWTALGYASIHIPPATVALYLIVINLSYHYTGEYLGNADHKETGHGIILAFIQIFAKAEVRKSSSLLYATAKSDS